MEKIWIEKEMYILIYDFLKFYALFPNLMWFYIWFLEVFSIKKIKKRGYYLQADVASGPRSSWRGVRDRLGVRRGTEATWQSPGGPHGAQEAHWVRPRGRRPRDHAVHVGARVGRHVAGWWVEGPRE